MFNSGASLVDRRAFLDYVRYDHLFINDKQELRGIMSLHTHEFVENYSGFVGFGFNRETDEHTIMYYLQKFSDDTFMKTTIKRLSDDELSQLFEMMTKLLKSHLSEPEYHHLFLKD
jgi:hypothetical protein